MCYFYGYLLRFRLRQKVPILRRSALVSIVSFPKHFVIHWSNLPSSHLPKYFVNRKYSHIAFWRESMLQLFSQDTGGTSKFPNMLGGTNAGNLNLNACPTLRVAGVYMEWAFEHTQVDQICETKTYAVALPF